MVLNLDELNILRSEPFDEYFGIMRLSKDRILRRIEFADKFETLMLSVLVTMDMMLDYNALNWGFIDNMIQDGYDSIIRETMTPDRYTDGMIKQYISDFRKSMEKLTEPVNFNTPLATLWLLSADRARFNAENEANDVLNYSDYRDAVEKGYTKKTWYTEKDDRVRKTHVPLESKTIPINEFFKVGDAYMRFPKDSYLAANYPEEIIGCRCACDYS